MVDAPIKKIGIVAIFLISMAAILGASDFYYLAGMSAKHMGAAAIIAWLILALFAFLVGMYFAELISMFPTGGGIYEIAKETYGRFSSFMVAWLIWIVGNFSMALAIVAAVEYLLPYQGTAYVIVGILFGIFWIVALNYMAFRGLNISTIMIATFGVLTLGVCLMTIIPSLINIPALFSSGTIDTFFSVDHFIPFFESTSIEGNILFLSMTIFLISELWFGFESVSFLANDTKNPEKTLPNALMITIGIVTLLLLAYFIASLGVLPLEIFASASVPFGLIGKITMGPFGEKALVLGTYLIILGGAALWPVTGARLLKHMADDKLFVKQGAEIHKKTKTPYKAIMFQTIAIIAFFLLLMREFILGYKDPYEVGHALYLFLNMMVLFVTIFAVTVWRFKDPPRERPFKAPLGKVGPSLIIIIYVFCFCAWLYLDWLFAISIVKKGLVLMFVGIPLYLLVETHFDKYFIVKTNDTLAFLAFFIEKFTLPQKIIDSIVFLLGDIKGKKLLEYGCGVGTLTEDLAVRILPGGELYATDLSKKRARITERRIKDKGHFHVHVIHDEEHATRVHPDVPNVDVIASVNMVGYVQEVDKVLFELNRLLPINGKICVVENDKYFKLIPNVHWLSKDDYIIELFSNAGFKVEVTRTQGLLWEYVFIYGEKVKEVKPVKMDKPPAPGDTI
ncbi:hypothetical protein COV93_05900 [Candidatus Woesearchaeota archaeon CG11_big_fil_rev_8_21_14_0_20_43_8]|nr:MAG: hypothetical protein COV93_05900 [Candidatus Woesearchaeota archaeon CG11_big_fil_rev_8_21_14_0_20_43_8]